MNNHPIEQKLIANTYSLSELLTLQRKSFQINATPSADTRRKRLLTLKAMLENHKNEFITALNQDFGQRSDFETQIADLLPVLNAIKHACAHLEKWMRPERKSIAIHFQPAHAQVHFLPLGVVGVIAPWNFPVSLALSPTVSAVAAGNSVMIKPSEFTPATSALLEELITRYFDAGEIAVVNGDESVAREFSGLPFDHLIFTGATNVGKKVMRAASENLVPVTLELGGKSPVIIDENFSLSKAAASIAFGKFANAGQICIAPDYVLVPKGKEEEFAWSLRQAVSKMYPTLLNNNDYTAIINQRHVARINRLIADAKSKGARIIEINPESESFPDKVNRKIPPTVVLGMNDSMDIAHEEIFGPVLPVMGYSNLGEAIDYINARPRPLALYAFSNSYTNQQKLLKQTVSGGVTINDTLQHYLQDELPFGGVGPSGMGAYHGKDGFIAFSHKRSVFRQARFNGGAFVRAPYGAMARFVLKVMSR